jgi:hypothetical protein
MAWITVANGQVTNVVLSDGGRGYNTGDVLTASLAGGAGFSVTAVSTTSTFYEVPLVAVTGKGYGANATITVDGSGVVSSVVVSNDGGVGYEPGDSLTANVPHQVTYTQFTVTVASVNTSSITSIGDTFVLTPSNLFVVSPTAPAETWTLIKTNPIIFKTAPEFFPGQPRSDTPGIEVYTLYSEGLPAATGAVTSWSVVFNGDGTYTLSAAPTAALKGTYPITVNLIEGCSFQNEDIGFTLLPTVNGWNQGDTFSWQFDGTTSSHQGQYNYAVFGSVTGWQGPAAVGQWYWNGKIGFKIPALTGSAAPVDTMISTSMNGTAFTSVFNGPQVLNDVTFFQSPTNPANFGFFASGEGNVVAGSDNGSSWSDNLASLNLFPLPAGELLVALGGAGALYTTSDGVNWVPQNTGTSQQLNDDTFVPYFLSSLTGNTNPLGYSGGNGYYDTNLIIAVGDNGTILTSTATLGWSLQTSGVSNSLNSVAYAQVQQTSLQAGGGAAIPAAPNAITAVNPGWVIVVVGDSGTIVSSTDRVTWTVNSSGTSQDLNDVIYDPVTNAFIAVGNAGTIVRGTWNGTDVIWTNLNQPITGDLFSVAAGTVGAAEKFVAVGPLVTAVSSDGSVWTQTATSGFNAITYGDGQFVAVGGGTAINDAFSFTMNYVSSMAVPCEYTITFTSPTTATVQSNITGYLQGLVIGQQWTDNLVAFTLNDVAGNPYSVGDQVVVYIAPQTDTEVNSAYDETPYSTSAYDSTFTDLPQPYMYSQQVYPLYHSQSAVIFPQTSPMQLAGFTDAGFSPVASGDAIVIDKAFAESIRLYIDNADVLYPQLGSSNGWVPLTFKYYDTVVTGSYDELPYDHLISGQVTALTVQNVGTGYVNGTYPNVPLSGGSGAGCTATITVFNSQVSSVVLSDGGTGYVQTDLLTALAGYLGGVGSGFSVEVTAIKPNVDVALGYDSINTPVSSAAFSDLVTYMVAYSGGDPTQPVFTVIQPRYALTNRPASATITFDDTFFASFVPFGTKYSLLFQQQDSFRQDSAVKVSENLTIFDSLNNEILLQI